MAKTTKKDAAVQLLPQETIELVTDGFGLVNFLKGLTQFFGKASELEIAAQATLERARILQVPTNKAEDAAVQQFVRTARADRKAVDEHWEITALVSRFHKKLTAKRGIATSALASAEEIGTRAHVRYVAAEKARAEAEQRRLQAEEDARAEQQRLETLASYEAAAVAAEENSPTLSEREQHYVRCILVNYTPTVAARSAGYADPVAQAARLSTSAKIKAAIEAARTAAALRQQAEAVKELPLPADVVEVEPELNKGDRGTWTAQVVDLAVLRQAAFTDKTLGIPLDIFEVNQAALNRYARSLGKNIELWPGVAAKHKTTVV